MSRDIHLLSDHLILPCFPFVLSVCPPGLPYSGPAWQTSLLLTSPHPLTNPEHCAQTNATMSHLLAQFQMPVRRATETDTKTPAKKNTAAIPVARQTEAERREQNERVMRLKAQRAAEKAAQMEKEGKTPKKKVTTTTRAKKVSGDRSGPASTSSPSAAPSVSRRGSGRVAYTPPPAKPRKKMSFKEAMQEADNIKADDLKIGIKVREKRKEVPGSRSRDPKVPGREGRETKPAPKSRDRGADRPTADRPTAGKRPPSSATSAVPAYKPPSVFNKPKEELLRKRRRYEEDDEDSMDDFIDEDEEEQEVRSRDVGYDRDEIWRLMNRGKSRQQYYNDYSDDDDMEAGGDDIFEEEERSSKLARLEDRREEMEEKRRADEKKRRLGKR